MGTEVEHASDNITTAKTPSSTPLSGPKVSMFAKKSGFVIPKNKLSGSLVPIFRGTKKGDGDVANVNTTNQVQRKTKWGPDLTLDTTVRKGRASAYQIRINQISQQLTLGNLELEDNEDLQASLNHQLSKADSEMLEIEKQEIIGELLRLNPTYKVPSDYKPLLKEAKVPIPIKEYPGYNFNGLVLGPASDTLKRLEKETGAKVRVYGTKADTGGKVEVTPTNGKEADNDYEDLYVHVSAETFEKVDAAVALIELLVTPVSVNPAPSSTTTASSGDIVNATHLSQSGSSSVISPPVINQGASQPYAGSIPPMQGQFPQFSQPWFSAGPTQPPAYPQSGMIAPTNLMTPSSSSSTSHVSSMPFNLPSNMPSLFGVRPVVGGANFNPVMQNSPAPAAAQQPPPLSGQLPYAQQQGQPGGPRSTGVPVLQPPSPTISLAGPPHLVRPVVSAPLQPAASESGRWLVPPASQGPNNNNMMLMQNAIASHNGVSGAPRPISYSGNMITPLAGAPRPASQQQPHGGFSSGLPSESIPPVRGPSPNANAVPAGGVPGPRTFPVQPSSAASHHPQPGMPTNPFPGSAPNFDSVNSSAMGAPRPQHPPSSGDFTFQPHRPPHPAAAQVWSGSQPPPHHHHNARPPLPPPPVQGGHGPLAAPQPQFRPLGHHNSNNNNNPPVQGFPTRPPVNVNQARAPFPPPLNFAGTPPGHLVPPPPPLPRQPGPPQNVSVRMFAPPLPVINNAPGLGPFPPRPAGSQMHIQELPRPQRFAVPPLQQHFGRPPFSGRPPQQQQQQQQVYDPFSPTPAPTAPSSQMGGNAAARPHGESDPEYDDLMASVGVK
ncbi:leucine-rich repeat extensin-like protein 5 [Andrographis paniculata]|uniref:leucine-rich repeat extensin-like protein 5 n=1 Tax=Andrographis paniculata TaxID=175694 RepID=UPI0021E82E4B|nr:leucine-rich repeat extensin-like protein 5 [Andrographis paniculata]